MIGFNQIPEDEYRRRLQALLDKYGSKSKMNGAADVHEMFVLNNDRFRRESGKGCGGCRARVWRNLVGYAEKNMK